MNLTKIMLIIMYGNVCIIDVCSTCSKSKNDIQTNLAGFSVNNDLENEF